MRAQFPAESQEGQFVRQADVFRDWVTADGRSGYPAEAGRYHLYVSWACPWAHSTIIVRRLNRLEHVIGMTAVDPIRDERGWAFRDGEDSSQDPINGFEFLSEAYHATDPQYRGRYTVPVLWDIKTHRIVSNSDDDIMRMFETEFTRWADQNVDLYPEPHLAKIEEVNAWLYDKVNNGVYRAGFATSQRAYEGAARRLFRALDELDSRLSRRRYLIAGSPVETDWRLFTTLVRFDAVYYVHFKCNERRIVDYPHLSGYLRDLYQRAGIADTVKMDHIKRHYYCTHGEINPTRIVPIGPKLDFESAHGRDALP